MLITGIACGFASSFLKQYPAEKVGPSSFACDVKLRNAKFDTNLQALAIPVSHEEESIFTLLNEQNFTFQIDLVNTNTSCEALSIYEVIGSSTSVLKRKSCSNIDGILSAKVSLPEHTVTIKIVLDDIQLVGGVRIGLSGHEHENESYSLRELNFIQSFYSPSGQTLAQQATIGMALTKVCNY